MVVGKFNPPHLGHLHLIEVAAARVDRLYALLCDRPDQSLSAETRRAWLEDASPGNVTVLITPDDLPEASEPWAARTLETLPHPPDLAFTSEAWGPEWARLMGAAHVMVDLDREAVPVSATRIRADLAGHFHWLVPAARADLARRVVLVGAESTGKSTLAEAMAHELRTVWVPEHGRWYWMGRRHVEDQSWTTDEFRRIAAAQRRLEDDLARRAVGGVVVADTDALVTAAWHERYLGHADPELEAVVSRVVPDLYLICCPDIPWVQDGTRESEAQRIEMHEAIAARAEASAASVVFLRGSHEERLADALRAVRALPALPPLV